ncbi:unnamed protein product [Linum trigynum]|uniref:DM2 domain-containing protein n=1 Tax=Linum trigynum TaxID=586398 RepID=A0AAV2CDJ1_9ROSI
MTDHEISQALHSLLHSSSSQSSRLDSPLPPFTSLSSIVGDLELKLGIGLAHKTDFIRAQIQQYLLFQPPPPPPHLQSQQYQPPLYLQHQDQPHSYQYHLHQQHQPFQHQHPQIHTHQPLSSIPPKEHYAFQQTPHFHSGIASPNLFSSSFPGGLSFHSIPAHSVKPDNTTTTIDPSKASGSSKAKRRGGAGGLNKLCGVSPELEAVVGHPALPRTEIVKQLWAYIRKNNLQDPSNKRKIICDDALRVVFETDCTDMFKMNKLLSKHITHLDPNKEPSSKKQKVASEEKKSSCVTQIIVSAAQSSSPSPAPSLAASPAQGPTPHFVGISEELANFFGVEVREMPQSEVLNRVLEYINSNNLKDPVNPGVIVCDMKLQELFGCHSFPVEKIMDILSCQHTFRA